MTASPFRPTPRAERGFSMIELMVAMTVTLIVTGAMYGMIASGQSSFRKEPAIMDRQQQIRIAMSRIAEDIIAGGLNIGTFTQAFAPNLNATGPLGVTAGQNSDKLEVRSQTPGCPPVRIDPDNPRNGANYNAEGGWPSCYPEPGWVLAFFPDGNAKWGWGHNQHGNNNSKFNFPPGQQPTMSQMEGVDNLQCSLDVNVVGTCPPENQSEAIFFAQMDMMRWEIAADVDGTPALYRSASGGFSSTTETFTGASSTSDAWQQIARGIEDMQIQYRVQGNSCGAPATGWVDGAPLIVPNNTATDYECIIREVRVTLWARALGVTNVTGETTAANGVTAVRGSLTTTITPRAALMALQGDSSWH